MPTLKINENLVTFSSFQTRQEGGKAIPAQVRVFTSPYGRAKKIRVHVREYYLHPDTGEYTIGRGIAFPPEALEEVIQGLILAQEAVSKELNV